MSNYQNWKAVTDDCQVRKDGKILFTGTNIACFAFILDNQSQSVYHALTYEGYEVVDAPNQTPTT